MKSFVTRALGVALGLLLGAVLLYMLLPPLRAREDRRRLLAAHKYCQVMLIGPSYADMITPKVFDAEARRIGLDKRVCKLGRAAMTGYELVQELDAALSKDWPKLELVLVDITLGRPPSFPEENWFKSRTVAWHTLEGIRWLEAYYADFPRRKPGFREALAHFGHVLAHYASIGRAPELFGWRERKKSWNRLASDAKKAKALRAKEKAAKQKLRTRKAKAKARAKAKATPEPKATQLAAAGKIDKRARPPSASAGPLAKSAEKAAKHREKLMALTAWNAAQARRPRYQDGEWVRRLQALIKSHGREALFVIAPVWSHPAPPAPGKHRVPLLRFNDPTRFPELYTPQARGRTSHVSRAGRVVYSRILANALLPYVKRR